MPLRTLILCYFSQFAKNVLVTTFLVNHIFSSKCMFRCYYQAEKYRSLERPEGVPSNVPRTSPKHPIWPSRGRYHLAFWGSPNLTSQGLAESTSWGCILVGVPRHSQYFQKTSEGRDGVVCWMYLNLFLPFFLNSMQYSEAHLESIQASNM